jgi:Family of unknown function (DUF6088)
MQLDLIFYARIIQNSDKNTVLDASQVNRSIELKKTTPRNLKARGKISSLVNQALREFGKDNATEVELEKIVEFPQPNTQE